MTVQTSTNVATGIGNGVTTVFPVGFKFNQDEDLIVVVVDDSAQTETLLTLYSDYTVTGAGDENGGSITLLVGPPPIGKSVVIKRVINVLQLTDLRNQGKFFAEVHEDSFDKSVMIDQQQQEQLDRTLSFDLLGRWNAFGRRIINVGAPTQAGDATRKDYVDAGDQAAKDYSDGVNAAGLSRSVRTPEPISSLPIASSRAGRLMSFDALGNPITVAPADQSASALAIELQNPADPEKGAAILGRGVVAIDSIAALLALPSGARRADLRYTVKGYYTGSELGGGDFYYDAARSGENDGGKVFFGFVRLLLGPLLPEHYGARGDGITIDTPALNSFVAQGGQLALSAGKTYLVDRFLFLPARTVLDGRASTLKRINGFNTAITSAVTSAGAGQASFTVTSVGDLAVGQTVMLYKTGVKFPYNQSIVSISGTTITISTHPTFDLATFGVGSSVCRAFRVMQLSDYAELRNLFVDGNRVGNQGPVQWQNHQALIGWLGTLIYNCRVLDEPGEGILQFLDGGRILRTTVDTCGGNGIHFSGGNGIAIDGCRIANTNLTADIGHEDGNLSWSNLCRDIVVTNCQLVNGKSAFGSIDYDGNSDVTLAGNVVRNQRESALDMLVLSGAASAAGTVVIANNRFYDSKKLVIKDPSAVNYAKNIVVNGNVFFNTYIDAAAVKGLGITGNVFDSSEILTFVSLNDCDFTLTGNTFSNGAFALIYIKSRGAIEGNTFSKQLSGAIVNGGTGVNRSDVIASGNFINSIADNATLNLVVMREGDTFIGNRVLANGVKYAVYLSGNGCVVTNNRVKVVTGQTIRIDAGFADEVVKDNFISVAVNNASAAPSNVVVDNLIVA